MKAARMHLVPDEQPDRVHGRLLEAAELSGYTGNRACDALKWLLRQDRWKQVSPGYDDINRFLKTVDLSEFRLLREQRKEIVQQLAAIDARQRVIARALGVTQPTVRADLGLGEKNLSPVSKETASSNAESAETPTTSERNLSLPDPYYEDDGITIYHGDARDVAPLLKPGLMVTDPPYNVGYRYNEYGDNLEEHAYWAFLAAVLRPPFIVIHYPEAIFPIARAFECAPDKVVAWVYHANTPRQWRSLAWFGLEPDLTRDSQPYKNEHDKRILALKAAGKQGARVYDWWRIDQVKNVNLEKTDHPCQIPLALMLRILRVTPFDGPVIDPFCGSGTTLLAAQELGRQAIGIDSSEEYCEIAALRLRQRPLELVTR